MTYRASSLVLSSPRLHALSLALLVWLVFCDPAQAGIVENGSTIEFKGLLRPPGNIEHTRVIHRAAFADGAEVRPPCTQDDLNNFRCRTQNKPGAPFGVAAADKISVQEALIGILAATQGVGKPVRRNTRPEQAAGVRVNRTVACWGRDSVGEATPLLSL